MTPADRALLREARESLERQDLVTRLSGLVGTPTERLLAKLPGNWEGKVQLATRSALEKAAQVALRGLDATQPPNARSLERNRWATIATGAVGGALGLAALPLELPASTVLLLRGIAEVARAEGEALDDPRLPLECVSVFALGGYDSEESGANRG